MNNQKHAEDVPELNGYFHENPADSIGKSGPVDQDQEERGLWNENCVGSIAGLEIINGFENQDAVLDLFDEYTRMLVSLDESFGLYLTLQHYDQEIQDLHSKYSWPGGRLYLATVTGHPAGCVALRRLDEKTCELKRLYVKPAYRGCHLGDILLEKVLKEARSVGYVRIKLDTLSVLRQALGLYRKHGFEFCSAYNESPADSTLFMEKVLN